MSFLQPTLLLGLPAVLLPIVIHLLNQRRHHSVPWAASMFVKAISKQNRGHARLRQRLILLLRMLAIAALILVVSRPLVTSITGLSSLGNGREQFILVDRSPSMGHRDPTSGLTRRESLLGQVDRLLDDSNANGRRHVVQPHQLTSTRCSGGDLVSLPETTLAATTSDIPQMVETALDKIERDSLGPSDIWVCSDLQALDWKIDSGRWTRIAKRLEELTGTKLRVLEPAASDRFNVAVQADNVVSHKQDGRCYLQMDLMVHQNAGEVTSRTLPIVISVAGIKRRLNIDLVAGQFRAERLRVDLPQGEIHGGGVVQLPADANASDNQYYFSFAPPAPRRTVVVTDDPKLGSLMKLACTTQQAAGAGYACDVLPTDRADQINWADASMILWHAPIPTGPTADRLTGFVDSGRSVLFFPPSEVSQSSLFGVRWSAWQSATSPPSQTDPEQPVNFQAGRWTQDDDLLATADDGQVLPVADLHCRRRCRLDSTSGTTLARFADNVPMLVRAATTRGRAYFLATLPTPEVSNFVDDAVVLFVMLHRCLDAGAAAADTAQQLVGGKATVSQTRHWKPLDAASRAVLPSQRPFSSGLYASGQSVVAVNRDPAEDLSDALDRQAIADVLGEQSVDYISAGPANLANLASEIWKPFAVLVIVALLLEGWISLPPKNSAGKVTSHRSRQPDRFAGEGSIRRMAS